MNRQASKTIGITLLLAAGLLAALFADGVFAPPGADAQTQSQEVPPSVNTVDGGRDQELVFNVSLPSSPSDYLNVGDKIKITLPGFDLSSASFSSPATEIEITKAAVPSNTVVNPSSAVGSNGSLILTLPDLSSLSITNNDYLIITIEKGSGILTPEIPKGFDDSAHPQESGRGYPVVITLKDMVGDTNQGPHETDPDDNIVVVRNPLSSTVPSEVVRVTLVTSTDTATIRGSDEIVVDFSGPSPDSEFVVPANLRAPGIQVKYQQPVSGGNTFAATVTPSGVLVQGEKVTLTLPQNTPTTPLHPVAVSGEYTIIFNTSAGIKNPYSAGNPVITISSFVEGDERDDITAVVRRTTTIEPPTGPRGTEFTLTGKGYAEGTVTIFHDANYNTGDTEDEIDPGETLASVDTVKGAFTVRLTVRGKPGDLLYRVRTRDSEGVVDRIDFTIESGMFFEPLVGRVGSPLRITISDWQELDQEVAAVSVGGETAYIVEVKEYVNCFEYTGGIRANGDKVITLLIDEVPPDVPEGKQTVSFYGYDELIHGDKQRCNKDNKGKGKAKVSKAELKDEPTAIIKETVDIDREELTLSPPTAARGQKVTITGSGFSRAAWGKDHIESVWIGGNKVAEDHSWFEVGTNGDIAFAVTVPLDVPDGANEVLIQGTDSTLGESVLTVPRAAISLDPPLGSRGTDLTITGSGFIANELVTVTYGAGVGAPLGEAKFGGILADSQGGFELEFQVPITAEVGKRHLVTAVAEEEVKGETVTVEAEASHLIIRANIITSPDAVSPGERLTIRGQHLPTFSLVGPVSIAGIELSLDSGVATDEYGDFETDILIPHIDYGDHTLLVQVGGVISPHIVNLAPPPLNGSPGQVFKYLVRDGVLLVVWHFDNATQSWSVFDPSLDGEMAALNDLTEVGSSDIVWVNLRQPQFFQESELLAGWNLITLK